MSSTGAPTPQSDWSFQDTTPWELDPETTFLNHGSFGACPRAVLDKQVELRRVMEREPVRFFTLLEPRLDGARERLAAFLGCHPEGFAFVPNATAGVNTVLRSLRFSPGDRLLTTDHEYNASKNALVFAAERDGAQVDIVPVPFSVRSADDVIGAILERVTERTRLALLDHVTSPTGMVWPMERLVPELESKGVQVLVDGAHAPGMIPLRLTELGASYYTGNFHKWLCAPKGSAFLYVREDRRQAIRPLSISHGANAKRAGRSRFRLEFDWTGTADPSPYLGAVDALCFMETLVPGGWPEIMRLNHEKVVEGRRRMAKLLSCELPCPDELLGSLATLPLPDSKEPLSEEGVYPLQTTLLEKHRIQVPIVPWPKAPHQWVRISAQLYNRVEQYQQLAHALVQELG
jgi:isopenicillin-N epimerase